VPVPVGQVGLGGGTVHGGLNDSVLTALTLLRRADGSTRLGRRPQADPIPQSPKPAAAHAASQTPDPRLALHRAPAGSPSPTPAPARAPLTSAPLSGRAACSCSRLAATGTSAVPLSSASPCS
jgi:hypothetical protein